MLQQIIQVSVESLACLVTKWGLVVKVKERGYLTDVMRNISVKNLLLVICENCFK